MEWSGFNKSLLDHPPSDLLVAAYLGYKSPSQSGNFRDAARHNSKALQENPMLTRGKQKTIDQMPTFVRSPEMIAIIERMKREAQGGTHAG